MYDVVGDKTPKLTDTYVKKLPVAEAGTRKFWDNEIKGFVLFVGKPSKTWYFQKDVGGQTKRILIGRYPVISAGRQTALGFALEMSRGAGKRIQIGAPTLLVATQAYLASPKRRPDAHKEATRQQFELHLKDWLNLPLHEISKSMAVQRHRDRAKIPSGANHVLKAFRTVCSHARRTHDLPENPTSAIEWYEERPDGRIIEDLSAW
ncbi:MAG: Arm DNA-binding domain-containing protein [Roseobacter sp.]